MNNISFAEVVSFFRERDDFLILCHTNPDEDTLGSAYALYLALAKSGKRANLLCDMPISRRSSSVVDGSVFLHFDEPFDCEPFKEHTVVSVDVASSNMLGLLKPYFQTNTDLKIDHHAIGEDFATYNFTEAEAGACGMILYRIIKALGVMDKTIASSLYMAISADTGGFRYSNTTAETHRIAAELLEAGADGAAVNEALFETKSRRDFAAQQLGLSKMRFLCDGLVSLISINNADKEAAGIDDRDLGELPSIARQPEGVVLGVVLKQTDGEGRRFKFSTRSREGFDAAALCQKFGGGGHVRAAGASIEADSLAEAEKKLLDAIYPMIGDMT